MLWTIFVVLVILWLLGMVTSYAPRPLSVARTGSAVADDRSDDIVNLGGGSRRVGWSRASTNRNF
jgi:Family of unknown function (DUF5670)